MATCRLKTCRRVVKTTADDSTLLSCDVGSCEQTIHRACVANLLLSFNTESVFEGIVCSKRCFNAILKSRRLAASFPSTRKRVPWHNDGPNDSISSLSVLMNWLTSGNNYRRYRGGEGQAGETKQVLACEVVDAIAASGIKTIRTSKDVMTKILGLESSFRVATDWLANTGQGVENEESLRAAVLQRCPTFYELYPVMDDSPSTHPLLLNSDLDFRYSDNGSESSSSGVEEGDSACPSAPITNQTGKRSGTVLQSIVHLKKGKKSQSVVEVTHEKMLSLKEAQLAYQKEIELKKLSIQQEELLLRQRRSYETTRETEARVEEAKANAVRLQAEADHWKTQRIVLLLRERMKLKAEGVPQHEIDLALPLAITASLELPEDTPASACDAGLR